MSEGLTFSFDIVVIGKPRTCQNRTLNSPANVNSRGMTVLSSERRKALASRGRYSSYSTCLCLITNVTFELKLSEL